ncbi:MAG: 2-oxoacid:acceptor oxidoreductase family protein [Candidatus Freyarchaeota archaeon]
MGKVFEVRWHGRGGQGIVTAAKLLAVAAFHEGFKGVQSIPWIGAERRGAQIEAYNRISNEPILLHSQVYQPDVVIVTDPSIILENNEAVIRGLKSGGLLLLNINNPNLLRFIQVPEGCSVYAVNATMICMDLNLEVAGLEILGVPMLGAFAKATGMISIRSLKEAFKESFTGTLFQKNFEAVEKAFTSTNKLPLKPDQYVSPIPPSRPVRIPEIHHWTDLPPVPVSTPSKGSIGKTGSWRTHRPVIDEEKCVKCLFCWMYCPEAAITVNSEGYPQIDYDYCKGCGICSTECPKEAIRMIVEERWEAT